MTKTNFNNNTMSLKVDKEKSDGSRIHSGAFMVSHFNDENEIENQDYYQEDEDDENDKAENPIIMKFPETSANSSVCMELERYKSEEKRIAEVYEIDSDLSQVFNTLNVTYKQKLTSPKWNPFKGIRLRWKEKIRLNNVIWRCWHMQFILKKKPFVCQFASPLDVDVHNTPQAIILEGKYWKRNGKLITAEYKKWRRFNINKNLGTSNLLDTRSELDTLEWATNDMLMLADCMPSDTLFSTVSQIPFPDHREISRAGRADFIQPSLGSLQPNFDDLMDFDLDILNSWANNRLAPVPEEQTEDILRAIEYPSPLVTSPMMQNVNLTSTNPQQNNLNDNSINLAQNDANTIMLIASIHSQDSLSQSQINHQQSLLSQPAELSQVLMDSNSDQQMMTTSSDVNKDTYREKISRGSWKQSLTKRGLHNYDQCPPTANQTTIYNQMLAQHQQKPLSSQQPYSNATTLYNNDQSNISQSHISPIQTTTNNFNSLGISSTTNVINQNVLNLSPMQMSIDQQPNPSHQSYIKTTQGSNYRYHGSSHGNQPYKIPHQNQSDFGVSSSRSHMRQPSPPHVVGSKTVSFQQPNTSAAEAMIRSISLPLNPNIQLPTKEGDFLMPKYPQQQQQHVKERRSSLRHTHSIIPMLQSAASEPSLNVNTSALAQLLTNSQSSLLTGSSKSQSVTSVIHHQQPVRANSFTSTSLLQNQITMNVNTISGIQQQTKLQSSQQQPSSSTSNTSGIYTPTLSPDSAFQESHDISSPERKMQPREHQRRAGHIHAEQKRRYNIKNGFDMLHSLIPQLQQNPSAKLSKASMLQKGAEYIKQLRMERAALSEQMESLRKEIETLTNSLNHLQSALPANGATNVSRQRNGRMKEMYQEFVMQRTMQNWKYWIFGQIFEPLLTSYNATVSTANFDELCRTTMLWIDNSCSLVEVRPAVCNKLREISTTTDILSDNPTSLQEEVMKAVQKMNSTRSYQSENRP